MRRRAVLILALGLGLGSAVPDSANDSANDASSAPADPAESLLRSVRRIAGKVEALRGERFVQPPVAVRVPDELRAAAAEIRAYAVIDRERLAARGRAWADLGLGGPASPQRLVIALARDLDGIGFDPSENRLLVANERLTEQDFTPQADLDGPATILLMTGVRRDEPLVGHLLLHVRQRERLAGDFLADTTDLLLTRAALAEGEANLLAIRYLFEGLGIENEVLSASLGPGEYLDGSLVPAGLAEATGAESDLLRFVYDEGFHQVVALFEAGGWARVDKAIRGARTTRDLLHPDRGTLTEAQFPDGVAPVPGLKRMDVDSLGEQGIFVLVSRVTGKDNLALQVGDGWVGDRLSRWEGAGNAAATEWVTRWATPEDAADFVWGWGKMLNARFPKIPVRDVPGGSMVSTPELSLRLERSTVEVRVLVLSGSAAAAETETPASR